MVKFSLIIGIVLVLFGYEIKTTKQHCYNENLPLLKVVNDSIYPILDNVIYTSSKCTKLHDSIFIIEVLPIEGYLCGGIHICRAEEDYTWERSKSKGYFMHKNYMFIVVSEFKEDFYPMHWAFVSTKKHKIISFCIRDLQYIEDYKDLDFVDGDADVIHKLSWWYLYDAIKDNFKLRSHYDCLGRSFVDGEFNGTIKRGLPIE